MPASPFAGDLSFGTFAQQQDAAIQAGMDAAITASLNYAVPTLRGLLVVYVCITFMLWAMAAQITLDTAIRRVIRPAVIVWLIAGAGIYSTNIADLFMHRAPDTFASVVFGTGSRINAAQQFDVVSARADNLIATARGQIRGVTPAAIGNSIAVWFVNGALQGAFTIIGGVWLLGRKILAIILVLGPWLLCFELFDRTRGWVDQWLGKLIGLMAFQLASSVLMQNMVAGQMTLLAAARANTPNWGIDELIGNLFHIASFCLTDALTMLALPAAIAFGSGIAASHGIANTLGMAASRGAWAAIRR